MRGFGLGPDKVPQMEQDVNEMSGSAKINSLLAEALKLGFDDSCCNSSTCRDGNPNSIE